MSTPTTPEQRAAERIIREWYDISQGMSSATPQVASVIAAEFADERKAAKELVEAAKKALNSTEFWCDFRELKRQDCFHCRLESALDKFTKL